MHAKFINKTIDYTGKQLVSFWTYKNFGIAPPSIVAFIGKCNVFFKYMVDIEDKKNKKKIFSEKMLHFIVEEKKRDLEKIILRQRLLINLIKDEFCFLLPHRKIYRKENNLYEGNKKLTVCVATLSNYSGLIHLGINISNRNTPIKTCSLQNYHISPLKFGETILKKFTDEYFKIKEEEKKVKKVK